MKPDMIHSSHFHLLLNKYIYTRLKFIGISLAEITLATERVHYMSAKEAKDFAKTR